MAVETWSEYVRRVAGTLTQVQIAERTGLAQTNVGRWLRGDPGIPRAEGVIAFARAFHQSPVKALAIAGYLTADEAELSDIRTPLGEYSRDELWAELSNRFPES